MIKVNGRPHVRWVTSFRYNFYSLATEDPYLEHVAGLLLAVHEQQTLLGAKVASARCMLEEKIAKARGGS